MLASNHVVGRRLRFLDSVGVVPFVKSLPPFQTSSFFKARMTSVGLVQWMCHDPDEGPTRNRTNNLTRLLAV
jgi:hypothetical protein